MALTKKQKIVEFLVFSFFITFPFGRLLAFDFNLFGFRVSFILLDFLAFIGFILLIFSGKIKGYFLNRNLWTLFLPFIFSFIYSVFLFKTREVLIGFLYFARVVFYLGFCLLLFDFLRENKKMITVLFDSLLSVLFFSLLFGFVQYFFYPDLTSLKFLGWDDHLFRMTGTFLDPGFTGIIFVFGFILSWVKYKSTSHKRFIFLAFLFLLGVSLTFSRASYFSLLVSVFYLSFLFKEKWLKIGIFLMLFILILSFVPKPAGEGVNLKRLYSVSDRVNDYKETLKIFSYSPLFGVGFDNLCLARRNFLGVDDTLTHSCSGSSSSFLLILSTLGVVGFMIIFYLGFEIFKKIGYSQLGFATRVSFISLLVHSQFDNSLFYPWVLAFLAVILALEFASNAKTGR